MNVLHKKSINYIPSLFKILIIIFMVIFSGITTGTSTLAAEDIYAFIKSADVKQFDEVINGFKETFPDASIKILNLEGQQEVQTVGTFISSNNPSAIICLGAGAAITAARIEKTRPIIFSMVLNYQRYKQLQQGNITGIAMEIRPATLFTQFRLLYPKLDSIGVPYHPEVSTETVRDAINASKLLNIKILPIELTDPGEMEKKLKNNNSKINGLWMIADFKLYNKNTRALEELVKFSRDNKKPLLAFSEPFIKAGSFFSVSTDSRSLGSQLALISKQIVHDKISPSAIPIAPPIGTFTVINKNVAREIMGDKFNESILYLVDKVYPAEEE